MKTIREKRLLRLTNARIRKMVSDKRIAGALHNEAIETNNLLASEVSKLQESLLSWKDAWFRQRAATGKYGLQLHDLVLMIRNWMYKEPNAYSDRIAAIYSLIRKKYIP